MVKGKKKPPSRQRYEETHPVIAIRVDKETGQKIRDIREKSGKSYAEIIKQSLGVQSRSTEESYRRGYRNGYSEARKALEDKVEDEKLLAELVAKMRKKDVKSLEDTLERFSVTDISEVKNAIEGYHEARTSQERVDIWKKDITSAIENLTPGDLIN
jgi:hypothetical protein